jgi:hypothetical protein
LKAPYLEKIFGLEKPSIISNVEFEFCVLCGEPVEKTILSMAPREYDDFERTQVEIQAPYITIDSPYTKLGVKTWNFPKRFYVCNECFQEHQDDLEKTIISKTLRYATERLRRNLEIIRQRKAKIRESLLKEEREESLLIESLNKLQKLKSK